MSVADELGDRMGTLLSIILTFAALKIVSAEKLPKIGYLTILDQFMLGTFFMACLVAFQTMANRYLWVALKDKVLCEKFDYVATCVYLGANIIMMICLYVIFKIEVRAQQRRSIDNLVTELNWNLETNTMDTKLSVTDGTTSGSEMDELEVVRHRGSIQDGSQKVQTIV
jgi:hypothetical protein